MTDYHRYNTPGKGQEDWHIPLNQNFEQFDVDMEVRDKVGNLADYSPKQGAKFFAVDTGQVYIGEDEGWIELESYGKDVEIEEVRNQVGSARLQACWDGLVVPHAEGLGVSDAIEPSTTTTPVQNAIDAVHSAGGGRVCLPPTRVTENDTISMKDNVELVGFGAGTSEISIGQTGIPGIEFDSASNNGNRVNFTVLDGFALFGPGATANTGPAIIHSGGNTSNLTVGVLNIVGWHDAAYKVERGILPFQTYINRLNIYNVDAGDTTNQGSMFSGGALIQWNAYDPGPANYFGTISAYPVAGASGKSSRVVYMRGGHIYIGQLNLGGTVGEVAALNNNAYARIDWVNWEPVSPPDTPTYLIRLAGHRGPKKIGVVRNATGTIDHFYQVTPDNWIANDAGNIRMGMAINEATLTGSKVAVTGQTTGPVLYEGNSGDIDVQIDTSLNQPISALGNLASVSN